MAEVHEADGTRQGVHYWNRLPDGAELDLTREQFRRGEIVGEAGEVERPRDVTRGRLAGQYHLLAARVARVLAGASPGPRAVTLKPVCRQIDGRGCSPQVGELFQDCLRRELREETGIEVMVDNVLGVFPGTSSDVVAYACVPLDGLQAQRAAAANRDGSRAVPRITSSGEPSGSRRPLRMP
jgi:hypothetical protein